VNSKWELSLPKVVRSFDYGTISDVILRISYTAEEDKDSGLKSDVEGANGVVSKLADAGVVQTLSLRRDFPAPWQALLAGTSRVEFEVREVHVPFFMSAFNLAETAFDVLVEKLGGDTPTYPVVKIDDAATTEAGPDAASSLYQLGRSRPAPFVSQRSHSLEITDLGTASTRDPVSGEVRLDTKKVKDILLRVVLKKGTSGP
jgi:hypothetical protein